MRKPPRCLAAGTTGMVLAGAACWAEITMETWLGEGHWQWLRAGGGRGRQGFVQRLPACPGARSRRAHPWRGATDHEAPSPLPLPTSFLQPSLCSAAPAFKNQSDPFTVYKLSSRPYFVRAFRPPGAMCRADIKIIPILQPTRPRARNMRGGIQVHMSKY